jgi:hypothetical protein
MSAIVISDNRPIEYTDLEAHVNISRERYRILEERIARAESEIAKMHEEKQAFKRMVFRSVLGILSGIILLLAPKLIELLIKG